MKPFNYFSTTILLKIILFIFSFSVLAIVFAHDYNRYPHEGHADEQAFAWAGFSLLKNAAPTSWSHFQYPDEYVEYEGVVGDPSELGIGAKLVSPWFDHAPLYAVLTGLGPYLAGETKIRVFDAAQIRLPSIIFFWGSMVVLFLYTRKLYGYWTGLFAMVIFSTVPLFAFGGRLALPEVGIAFCFLLAMYFWLFYEKSSKAYYLILIGLMVGLAGAMKYTGFFLLPLFIYLLIQKSQHKYISFLFLGLVPSLVGLAFYAFSLNPELYWAMLTRQGVRPVGWSSLAFIFGSPGYNISTFYDGWYIFGLLSAVVLAIGKTKNRTYVLWPIFYWITVVILTGGQQDMLPWYRFSMYPFLSIAIVLFIKKIVKRPDFFGSVMIFGLLMSSRHYLANAFRPDILPIVFRISFFALLVPVLIAGANFKSKPLWLKLSQAVLVVFISYSILLNMRLIYNRYAIICENITCPLRPGNAVSELRVPVLWRFLYLPPS